jgi:hypothetical protein
MELQCETTLQTDFDCDDLLFHEYFPVCVFLGNKMIEPGLFVKVQLLFATNVDEILPERRLMGLFDHSNYDFEAICSER